MGWWDRLLGREDELRKGTIPGIAPGDRAAPAPQAWNLDPFDPALMVEPETLSAPGAMNGLPDEVLRYLARVPTIHSVVYTRVTQTADFLTPQAHRLAPGFQMVMRDEGSTATKDDKQKMRQITDWLLTCGDPRIQDTTFENWGRKLMADSYTIDRACSEIITTRSGKVAGFMHVDAATIRRARPSKKEITQGRRNANERMFVQVLNNRKIASFDADQMMFGVRRPRGDMRVNGYGFPELEILVRYITYILNAEIYNAANFTNGVHAAGVAVLKSGMKQESFRVFERKWYALLEGASKAKKMPLVQLDPSEHEDLTAVTLSQNNREMEYREWMNFLLKGTCAVYGMDPAEQGYVYGNEGQSSSLASSSPTDRVLASKERGFFPNLRMFESWINRRIVWRLDPRYSFKFVGLNPESEQARLDNLGKAVKTHRTINEARAQEDLEPLKLPDAGTSPADWGPMDTTYIAAVQQAMAVRDQPQGDPEQDGDPNQDPEQDGDAGEDLPQDLDVDEVFGDSSKGDNDKEDADMVKGWPALRSYTVEV